MTKHLILLIILTFGYVSAVPATEYAAMSLKRASELLQSGDPQSKKQAMTLAGITRPYALIHDRDDLIFVGECNEGMSPLTLDDWTVAVRSEFLAGHDPVVSIDQTPETSKTGQQTVRFEGALKNTQFGADMLAADVVLKKLALGLTSAEVFGVTSFLKLSAASYKEKPSGQGDFTRFWFLPMHSDSYVLARDGVVIVEEYKIDVQNQRYIEGKATRDEDSAVSSFAASIRSGFGDLKASYPEIARMEQLYYMTAIAQGLGALHMQKSDPAIKYWLERHGVKSVETRDTYPMKENSANVTQESGKVAKLRLSGGINLEALVVNLQDGVPDTVKRYVLASRPDQAALSWKVPLVSLSWTHEIDHDEIDSALKKLRSNGNFGMSIQRQFARFQDSRSATFQASPAIIPPSSLQFTTPRDSFSSLPDNRLMSFSQHVGGVMLSAAATIAGAATGKVDLSRGNFSLVVDGQGAQLDPKTFRKFITALWAVYYSDQDPGISIDPIEWGGKDHVVRYIGRVINTDLGRTMREADYLMKKWAVGTERPDEPGFMNPDDIKGQKGGPLYGASSRFWFVPEKMSFKRAGNALVFDQGRMTVKTEFNLNDTNIAGLKADPSNQEFADFLTDHYGSLKRNNAVLDDLFEYAKMVGLAKYLKDSGVPLFWFLMANKDLVLTENSPGTVSALAKGSDYFRNIRIEGGVDMSTKGDYVMDEKLAQAILHARSAAKPGGASPTAYSYATNETRGTSQPFNFKLGTNAYSVVPQHSLTSGKDRRGNRYQTDFAVRSEGFQASEEALDSFKRTMLRYLRNEELGPMVANLSSNELKKKYEALYQEAMSRAVKRFSPLAKRLDQLEDKEFSSAAAAASAVKDAIGEDLGEKLGPLFAKETHYKTDLELVRWFNPRQQEVGPFGKGWSALIPYQLKVAGTNTVAYQSGGATWKCPAKMIIKDLIAGTEETMLFNTNKYQCLAYVPEKPEKSLVVALYPRTDASFAFKDKLNNSFEFDPSLRLTNMRFSSENKLHIEYVNELASGMEQPPFEVEPAGPERVSFHGQRYYRAMRLKNLAAGATNETLYFNTSRFGYAAYVPAKADASSFKELVAFTDESYQLVDRQKNEIHFNRQGEMDKLLASSDRPLIASVSMGNQKIDFKYTADPAGHLVVGTTRLVRNGIASSTVAKYEYDAEGRLSGVKQQEMRTASVHVPSRTSSAARSKSSPLTNETDVASIPPDKLAQ